MQQIVGKLLGGRYKVTDKLGKGGGGETYTAQDMQRPGHPICVVKRLKPTTTDPELLDISRTLFYREAETLERLGQMHDQIPRLLAHFEEEEEFYLVQDFIEGHPLTAELPSGCHWSEAKVTQLLKDVLTTLEFVHSQSVIHRDVKPANIIRRRKDKKLVLIDFGAVKQVREDVQQTITQARRISPTAISIGTEGYMPSEQKTGIPYLSSDIYALGMIGIQALTGVEPIHLQIDPHSGAVWQHRAQVSDQLAAVLDKMVRYYFGHRYQSATEALQALQDCIIQNQIAPISLVKPTEVNSEISDSSLNEIEFQVEIEETASLVSEPPIEPEYPEVINSDVKPSVSSSQLLPSETNHSPIEQPQFDQDIPETKYSQPEQLQPRLEIPETKYSQPERLQPSLEIPETKYSQPERLQPDPRARYSSVPGHEEIPLNQPVQFSSQSMRKPLIIGLVVAVAGISGVILFAGLTIQHGSNSTPPVVNSPIPKPTETAEPESSPTLKGDYSQLKKYLNESPPNWEAADRETFRVMLEVAGSKSKVQGRFELTEWLSFSCKDLREIDRLWNEASDNKLGFSAQKRIFEVSHNANVFYRTIEWIDPSNGKRKTEWQYNSKARKSEYKRKPNYKNPPEGNLPAMLVWEPGKGESDTVDHRFDMMRACGM